MPENTLVNGPAEIVRAVLINLTLGSDPTPWAAGSGNDWPVYASGEPNIPDNCITVYDTQGIDHGQSMVDLELYQHFGFQVRVRASDYPTGRVKANAIRQLISQFGQQSLSGPLLSGTYLVWAIAKVGQVLSLGKETPNSKRSVFTLNGQIAVDQTA